MYFHLHISQLFCEPPQRMDGKVFCLVQFAYRDSFQVIATASLMLGSIDRNFESKLDRSELTKLAHRYPRFKRDIPQS